MAPDPTKPDAAALAAARQDLHRKFRELGYTTNAQTSELLDVVFDRLAAMAQRPDSAGSLVGDRDLALGLLRGLHPEITRDEPMEVAQQIFDHVQAEREVASRRIVRMQETIDALLRQLRGAPSQVATASAQSAKRDATSQAAQREETCEWWQDGNEDGTWFSACGGDPWRFEAEDPTKNGMRFCIHCGKRMVQRDAARAAGAQGGERV
ncbi:MAG TPA: hypothetical protein VF453_06410 [Burkholderiaceae bacterium]